MGCGCRTGQETCRTCSEGIKADKKRKNCLKTAPSHCMDIHMDIYSDIYLEIYMDTIGPLNRISMDFVDYTDIQRCPL